MSGVICAEPFVQAKRERKPYLECLQTYFGKTVLPGMRTVEQQSAHSSAGGERHQGQAHPYLQDQIELCFSVHLNTEKPFIGGVFFRKANSYTILPAVMNQFALRSRQ